MVKTKGSKDRVHHRKTRTDKGRKRKFYAGRKTKPRRNVGGRYIPYVSKRRRDAPIKIGLYERVPMSHEGYMNWNKKIRRKISRFVYGHRLHFELDPSEIDTEEKICNEFLPYLWEGVWEFRIPATKKNKGNMSYCAFGFLKIRDSPEGLKCKVIPNFKRRSLKRLWWWRGN